MIDIVYQLLKTIVNKELRGNVTPAEFNLIAKQVQDRIFRGYFEDVNRDKVKENRGLTSQNYGNLPLYQRQRMDVFSATVPLPTLVSPIKFFIPSDLYLIKENGVTTSGRVIQEMEVADNAYLQNSLAASSSTFPTYTQIGTEIVVTPNVFTSITLQYFRKPTNPKWTYSIIGGTAMFNNGAVDFQDFELNESEFPNIVIQMLSFFGINIRETEVTQYAEALKQKQDNKEER